VCGAVLCVYGDRRGIVGGEIEPRLVRQRPGTRHRDHLVDQRDRCLAAPGRRGVMHLDRDHPAEAIRGAVASTAVGAPRTPKGRTRAVAARLALEYPEAVCELDHRNAFELLAATILSAQTTDARVNMVTPHLFAAYPDAVALAGADVTDLEQIVRSTGFFQTKARNLVAMGQALVERFGGEVPTALDDLVTLPGVGRKTANVVRSVAFGLPGLPVDTHVGRLSRRLGLTTEDDAVKVELELNSYLPAGDRGPFSLRTILHGRRVCDAKKPACDRCVLEDLCPSSLLPRGRRSAKISTVS
jgi:endonuclease-3